MSLSRKIAYSATFTAFSVIAVVISRFLPLTFFALIAPCVCCFLACIVCGLGYGFLTVIASLLTAFLLSGINTVFILDAILFLPYSLVAYFMRKIKYRGVGMAIRSVTVIAMANVAVAICYFALSKFMDFDLSVVLQKIGGYAVFAVMFSVAAVIIDYLFSVATEYMVQKFGLKNLAGWGKEKTPNDKNNKNDKNSK